MSGFRGGYLGKILRIDLTRKKHLTQPLPPELAYNYIGGYGVGGRILYDEVPPWVGAFDPQNLLIFATGPVNGTPTPVAGRHSVVSKSPLTGFFGDANAGGFWGAELKAAGYDLVVITGRAPKPTYVFIRDGEVRFGDASPYWGMDARASDRSLKRDLGDAKIQVSNIGQAGENLVRFAGILTDEANRIAGRCGLGAVMGFMKLKAVAVRGEGKVPIAHPEELRKISGEVIKFVKEDKNVQMFSKGGTPLYFGPLWQLGDTPGFNYTAKQLNPEGLSWPGGYDAILSGTRSCYLCPIGCRRISTVKEGAYSFEPNVEGPEYETVSMLGSNCGVTDAKAVAKANDLCNLFGLDTISTGGTLAFAMECFEKGLLTKEDTDGVDLRFGNAEAMIKMIEKIAFRDGFGDILAEGSRRAAKIIGKGAEEYAIQVKGVELAAHDPRVFQGGGPHYACAITGGRHTEGITIDWEILGRPRDGLGLPKPTDSPEGKGVAAKVIEDWTAFISSAGWCWFADINAAYMVEENFVKTFNAVTGLNLTLKDALLAGERIINIRKAFNVKHGATRADDKLPKRLLEEKGRTGKVVDLSKTLDEYYEARGWDKNTSKPTKETLIKLGLTDVAKEIWG
ncbi:MAG: aldehyde ferredoxin oxidoreductase family protein [Nitrososphaerales archaeon]